MEGTIVDFQIYWIDFLPYLDIQFVYKLLSPVAHKFINKYRQASSEKPIYIFTEQYSQYQYFSFYNKIGLILNEKIQFLLSYKTQQISYRKISIMLFTQRNRMKVMA